jgi:hypothetical protein
VRAFERDGWKLGRQEEQKFRRSEEQKEQKQNTWDV